MTNFTLIETLVLAGILQAFIIVIAFRKRLKSPASEGLYFSLIIVTAVMLLARLLAFKYNSMLVYRFAMFADVCIFLFGPVCYAHLRKQFQASSKIEWFHFFPAVAHFVFFSWTCLLSSEDLALRYQEGSLPFIFFLIESLGLVSVAAYLVLAVVQFGRYLTPQGNSVLALIGVWSLAVVAWIVGYLDMYFVDLSVWVMSYDLIWIALPIWIHLVGYYKLISVKEKPLQFRTKVTRVKKEKQELIVQELKKVTEKSELFLDADLKLDDLAKEVNASPNDLSWVLNEVYHMTFYEFINKVRLTSFIDKVKQQEHRKKTLLALSFEVGFKSKSTFNNAFKAVYNQTPSQYITNYYK